VKPTAHTGIRSADAPEITENTIRNAIDTEESSSSNGIQLLDGDGGSVENAVVTGNLIAENEGRFLGHSSW